MIYKEVINLIGDRIKKLRGALTPKMTQTEFADALGVSRPLIASIETGRSEPTEMFIKLVCSTYNVNKDWLMTGEGEMFNELTRSEQIASFVGGLLSQEDDDFKVRFVDALTKLSPQGWDGLEELVNNITAEKEKTPDG